MKVILLAILLCGCSLVENDVKKRLDETKVRNEISLKKKDLKKCLPPKSSATLELSIGTNKQISFFKVISSKKNKELTDCLFKILDLLYFKDLNIEKPMSIKYFLTSK